MKNRMRYMLILLAFNMPLCAIDYGALVRDIIEKVKPHTKKIVVGAASALAIFGVVGLTVENAKANRMNRLIMDAHKDREQFGILPEKHVSKQQLVEHITRLYGNKSYKYVAYTQALDGAIERLNRYTENCNNPERSLVATMNRFIEDNRAVTGVIIGGNTYNYIIFKQCAQLRDTLIQTREQCNLLLEKEINQDRRLQQDNDNKQAKISAEIAVFRAQADHYQKLNTVADRLAAVAHSVPQKMAAELNSFKAALLNALNNSEYMTINRRLAAVEQKIAQVPARLEAVERNLKAEIKADGKETRDTTQALQGSLQQQLQRTQPVHQVATPPRNMVRPSAPPSQQEEA